MTAAKRRTQAERREEMRARLTEAAYKVIARRGHSAFRTAAVLEEAGVSQGAMLHHFPTKESLTLAAVEYALTLGNEKSYQTIETAGKKRDEIFQSMAEDFKSFFLGNRFWVSLDITMDAAKDMSLAPAIRDIVGKARQPIYMRWIGALIASGMGKDQAEKAVIMTAALISGYAVRTLWTEANEALDAALGDWFTFLKQL